MALIQGQGRWWTVILLAAAMSGRASGQEADLYLRQVKPVLQARCWACHGALKQEAGLRLDTAAAAVKGGEEGPVIAPGDAAASRILARVANTDLSERMPPEGEPLKPEQIAALKSWIERGAAAPADEQPERDPRDHWAFRAPVRPAVPAADAVADPAWVKNPIDAFIAAEHRKLGLSPQSPADKRVWLRRVTLDLIGLPPTPAELDAFLQDESADAHATVVTRLLDSPQYGERWGRHWMDIWRYSDWWGLGAEVRNSQKHIWHWRDWIIESLNADKGYDQMLREMLAADELYPNDLDRLRASGFLARQYFKFNRTSWLDETIEHTAKSMLGLTFNCAKCHDHKYDPFAQADYYRLRAVFEPYQVRTDQVPGESDYERDGIPRAFDCNLDAVTYLHIRGDDRNPDKTQPLSPAFPAFLPPNDWKIEPITLPPEAFQPGLRPFVAANLLKAAEAKITEAQSAVEVARKKLAESERAAAIAANKPVPEPIATPEKSSSGDGPLVEDNFSREQPDVWEVRAGKWTFENGRLIQSQEGATRTALRLKANPPDDFEAKLKYTTLGGQMWKSVGIVFDAVESHEALVYLSAYVGGPKAQVAYKTGGADYVYPNEGAQGRPIELNKPQELTVRVRGTLVNVLVNGELSIAYRLPIARKPGAMEIITFDARAEFTGFSLSKLPASVMLAEAKAAPSPKVAANEVLPVEQAKLSVAIAEKALAAAAAQPVAIRSRSAAEQARYAQPPAANAVELARAAVAAERQAALAAAEETAARAELDLARAAADKKADAEAKLAAAKKAVEAARAAVETPDEKYTPLTGSLKTLENNLESEDSRRKPFPTTSTGRRAAFARWLTDRQNPLPARVAVNHIWSRHFGRPLVPTVFDFGRKGSPPTHPELLDWLAVELMDNGWSMKHIHRLIVMSNTYRMTSSSAGAAAENLARDPDNRFYWRAKPIRMEAQLIRDSLLSLSGELDLKLGGPSIPVNDQGSKRRSLYFVHSHNEHQPFLEAFDDANVLDCYRRTESIVPQQALALENSPLAATAAEKIARRLSAEVPTDASPDNFLRAAFVLILTAEPTPDELATCRESLEQFAALAKKNNRPNPDLNARINLVHALLNHNDFVTVR